MFRLVGLLGGLSLATDIGTGVPPEESLKRCVVATRLARAVGCAEDETRDVMYTSLLQHLGCTAYAHEGAATWGDDIAFVRLAFLTDFTETGRSRARVLVTALTAGRRGEVEGPAATCEVARDASAWLGLPEAVQANLFHALAMWDGTGHPAVAGREIPVATRVMHVASTAVLFTLHAGTAGTAGTAEAVTQVRRRSGTYLDPELVDVFVDRADELVGDLAEMDAYEEVLTSEPPPVRLVDDDQLESVARTFGSLADLKSPWLQGHSAAVAELGAAAAAGLGLGQQVRTVRVAGHLHDLGRVGVSSRIWDKVGPLTVTERDQARLHPYYGERILARTPALADVAVLVGQHHERCDGSGYHRGLGAAQLTMPSRILAAADEYRSLVEDRPHRRGVPAVEAAGLLRSDARAGRLDADAVASVLRATGLRTGARRTRPADLTARQVEVLRLLAAGLSNQQIAQRLVISRRTAEHHVQDIYLKIGASTRAGAALFAMQHGLLDEPG
jgi:HD-GYP domain-containing protein (c-di-GMP phosphodiesterase class II)/predicted DNA-binding protein (UPF0251 family)